MEKETPSQGVSDETKTGILLTVLGSPRAVRRCEWCPGHLGACDRGPLGMVLHHDHLGIGSCPSRRRRPHSRWTGGMGRRVEWPTRILDLVHRSTGNRPRRRFLGLGCDVGRGGSDHAAGGETQDRVTVRAEEDGRSPLTESNAGAFAVHLVDLGSAMWALRQQVLAVNERKRCFG